LTDELISFCNFAGEKLFAFANRIINISISGDEQFIVTNHDNGEIRLWSLEIFLGYIISIKYINKLNCRTDYPVKFSGNNDRLFFLEKDKKRNKLFLSQFNIFSQKYTRRHIKELDVDGSDFVFFSPENEEIVLTSGMSYGIKKWDVNTGVSTTCLADSFMLNIHGFVSTSKGKNFLMYDNSASLFLYDLEHYQIHKFWKLTDLSTGIMTATSPDGNFLVVAYDSKIKVLDLDYMEEVYTINHEENGCFFEEAHMDFIYSIAFSPKGDIFASVGNEPKIRIWNLNSGREICSANDPDSDSCSISLAFTSNGKNLITGGTDGRIRIWSFF
jgi:WD40 repeat protein